MPPCLRAVLPAAALSLALFGFPATAGAGVVEYTGLTAGEPAGITAGPDGALWFTEQGSPGAIGRITTSGLIQEFRAGEIPGFTPHAEPTDIVAGPDGALWFTESGACAAIGRFDPATQTVTEFTAGLTPDSEPTAITVGPDGNLWFTERQKAAIGRITPEGDIVEFTSGLSGSSKPTDIAVGPDGNLWFTDPDDPGGIGRIDPGTGEITELSAAVTADGAPTSIVTGEDHKLYFTMPDENMIGLLKPGRPITGIPVDGEPEGIAVGGDGALWFTEPDSPGRLRRLWPGSGAIQTLTGGGFPGFSAGSAPTAVTRGPDGNIWYALRDLPGIARATVPPLADIGRPTLTETGKVRLKAEIHPNSQATTYHFEYGASTAYGARTQTASAGSGAHRVEVSAEIELARATEHHVRVVASNGSGTAVSDDKTFSFAGGGSAGETPPQHGGSAPAAEPPAETADGALPPPAPVLGETVTVRPGSGTIRFRRPGTDSYVVLEADASIPVGSRIDARAGKVVLQTALDATGRMQRGTFWGAVFQVRQARGGRGMTELALRGGRFSRCRGARASISSVPRRDAGRRRTVRSLWGRDRHGRFRTHGRDSVATVRGTVWQTADRCDGTLTRVKHGKVLVRDRRSGRRVLLTAGRSYLARHAR